MKRTRVCFVTGTRAEFGLMRSALDAISAHPKLELQVVATGMHLDPAHREGESILNDAHALVEWPVDSGRSPATTAINTGNAVAHLAQLFVKLKPDVVLVTGDRVEAFAAASAAHLCQIPLAHVHGGDRALGQIDDSLRHAITKLAHLHFPATRQSAQRIRKLGEDRWRIRMVGSPGIDGMVLHAAPSEQIVSPFPLLRAQRFALLILHPVSPDAALEAERARSLLTAVEATGFDHIVIIHPNNDPGSRGIADAWNQLRHTDRLMIRRDLPRPVFLGLLRDAAVLVGNSSSGIIEAASFGTPVIDVGPRQLGRERSKNVIHCEYNHQSIKTALKRIWNNGRPRRSRARNVYGGGGAGAKIADALATLPEREKLLRKLIAY